MKILLVDDDEIIRIGMQKMIRKDMGENCVIEVFSNGVEALEFVRQNSGVDLIITDIRMPQMDGLQLIEEVRKIDSHIKFIVLSGYDEFQYVRRAFRDGAVDYFLKPINRQELISHIQKIEKELQNKTDESKYEKLHKKAVLSSALENAVKNREQAVEQLRECIPVADSVSYLITILEIGVYYKNSVGKQDLSGHVSTMKTIYEADMKEKGYRQILFMEGNTLCSMIFLKNKDSDEQIYQYFHGMLDGFQESFLLSVGISRVYSSLNDINTAYLEAGEAVSFRFYKGNNKVLRYQEILGKSIDSEYDIKPLTESLALEIGLMDYPEVRSRMNQFFLDVSFMKPEKIRAYIKNMIYILALQVEGFEKALNCSGTDYDWLIGNIGTYNEMKEFIISLMKNCIQYMSAEKEKKQNNRIEMAKTFLEENYRNPLTLNDAAAHVELNPSYFSNLFKAEMGMNFSEYLMKIRMEKAMQLLRDPKVRIYEVGNMVGYEDAVSFGRAFKKFVGMSPKEYRNTVY